MLSVLLNIFTITLVAILSVFVVALYRKKTREPNVSASDVMDELIYGDRLAEVKNESAIRLMTGTIGSFEAYEMVPKLPMYLVT